MEGPRRVICIYAAGGIGKSTFLSKMIAHIHTTTGKRGRVVNADGGGTSESLDALIEAGIAEVWDIDRWDEKSIFYSLDMATKGWWPEDVKEPNSKLLPPKSEWKECPTCHKDSGARGFTMVPKCISCGVAFASGTLLKSKSEAINGMENVGVVGFEGLTSFGELLLRRLRKIDSSGGRTIPDGDYKISAPGQQHYLDAQSHLAQFVSNVRLIPTEVVVWTALENRGDDEGKPLYGPKGPGKALTTSCIPWFTDVLHLDALPKLSGGSVVKDKDGVEVVERKLFLSAHYPPDSKIYKFAAKVGGADEEIPSVIEPSASEFFKVVDSARERKKKALLG